MSPLTLKTSTSRRGALERRLMIPCVILIIAGIILIDRMPARISAMEQKRKYDSEFLEFADLFSEVYQTIRERYVKEVPSKQLFEGAINGMFATLDSHSSWMPPDSQEMLTRDTEGEYSGVGLHIQLDRHKILTVVSPIPGSPAAKAGVLPWDRIIEIEGKSTEGITMNDAVKKLTGPTGSSVKIKVWRAKTPKALDFSLKRENIKVDSVFAKVLDGDIGYLRLNKFQDDTADVVRKQLKLFNEKKVRGVIMDLRFNPGGLLDRAVEICDMFLPKNQLIVSIKGRNKSNNREFYSLEDPLCTQPLIVLVNHGSASASEIFAGAMKDTGRGVIVGPKGSTTYGKGSVQTISTVNKSLERDANGDFRPSGIRLTTALYYTPSGVSIHEKGIKPDIGIELPEGHELLLLRHGLLGDPNMVDPRVIKPAAPNGKKQGAPGSILFNEKDKKGSGADDEESDDDDIMNQAPSEDLTPTPDADTKKTTHSLEKILNTQPQATVAPATTPPKPEEAFHDIMLDEGMKYLKAIMITQNRKAA